MEKSPEDISNNIDVATNYKKAETIQKGFEKLPVQQSTDLLLKAKMIGALNSNSLLSTVYRQLNFGIKGLLYPLYYSGKSGENYKGEAVNVLIGNDTVRLKN